ncbi:MAG TPA: alpha/beta fold hydrolase, partial [Dokdonella sp.]
MRSRRRVRAAVLAVSLLVAFAAAATVVATVLLCAPDRRAVGATPADLGARAVAIDSGSGARLQGWFVTGRAHRGAVLLLHGVHANRLAMLGRARFLAAAGYAVLLIDFRAHGESGGDAITFGRLESRDARAALAFLRDAAPGERVGVIGVSMGGAAALLA